MLLKGFSAEGFVFFTNYESDKARELAADAHAALTFNWLELPGAHRGHRDADVARNRGSLFQDASARQLPRRVSLAAKRNHRQRQAREARLADAEARFPGEVSLPNSWGGYCGAPEQVEFQQGRTNCLHDRLRYRRCGNAWVVERLSP